MTDQSPEPVPPVNQLPRGPMPPGFSQNGQTPMTQLLHELPQQMHQAVAAALQQLPQMLFQAVAAALQQTSVAVKLGPCATCGHERLMWAAAHQAELAQADAAYAAAVKEMAAKPAEDQVPVQVLDFMPAHMRPGAEQGPPPVQDGVFTVGGTVVCPQHHPNAPAQQGRRQFLIANAGLSPAMIAELRSQAA